MMNKNTIQQGWNGTIVDVGAIVRCWNKEAGFLRGPKVRVLEIRGRDALVEVVKSTGAWLAGNKTRITIGWLEGNVQ